MSNKPAWAIIYSAEGEELEEIRATNSSIYCRGEVHIDRFRYTHKYIDPYDLKEKGIHCGTKYNPKDTSNCLFCQGYKYNRTLEEILDTYNIIINYNSLYYNRKDLVFEYWSKGEIPPFVTKLRKPSWAKSVKDANGDFYHHFDNGKSYKCVVDTTSYTSPYVIPDVTKNCIICQGYAVGKSSKWIMNAIKKIIGNNLDLRNSDFENIIEYWKYEQWYPFLKEK